jgi:DNA-binding winged helix-turn-helix (wHTH) protein
LVREIRRFGEFRFDPATGELVRGGRVIRLPNQPAQVLGILTARPGELVTREELRQAIWGDDTFVSFDPCLNYCVRRIRLALGGSGKTPKYFETVPRRGYRFVAPVRLSLETPVARQARTSRVGPLALAAVFTFGLATGALATHLGGQGPAHDQLVDWLHARLNVPAETCHWPWKSEQQPVLVR